MSCAACQAHVQKALEKTPGVSRAAVRLMAGDASVDFDPRSVTVDTLLDRVRDSGYDADLPAEEEQNLREQQHAASANALTLRAAVCLTVGVVLMALPPEIGRAHV